MKWLDWFKVELTEVATAKQVKELKLDFELSMIILENKNKKQECKIRMLENQVKKLEQLTSVLLDRPKLYTYKKKRW